MKKVELLSPAGNLTKLKIAVAYGADAVYASVGSYSLRQRSAKNFTLETFEEGIKHAHANGVKFYATINGFPYNAALDGIKEHIKTLAALGVDAFIIATPGVIMLAREFAPQVEIHLSTQANVTNWMDAKVYHSLGVKRIVAAREISLKDAVLIKEKVPEVELEIFCHGSMCFAYSGRCLVSAVQSGRLSNRGACANDCRFGYELFAKNEENNALFRIVEGENRETLIFNAKDLNLASHVQKILSTGVIDSLKIEGRTKSEYYAACSTNAYRMAIDDVASGRFEPVRYEAELATLASRGFTDGYIVRKPYEREDTQNFQTNGEKGTHDICGMSEDGVSVACKYKLYPNLEYEILSPSRFAGAGVFAGKSELGEVFEREGKMWLRFDKLVTKEGKEMSEIHSGNLNLVLLPVELPKYSFLRRVAE